MSAQQRLRPHRGLALAEERRDPAERRQHEPVAGLEPRPTRLPTENRQLVPPNENLLGTIAPNEQQHKHQHPVGSLRSRRNNAGPLAASTLAAVF